MLTSTPKYIIGIDEVGRGPLAGPVAVGAFCIPAELNQKMFRGVRDSKQLTPLARDEWYEKIRKWQSDKLVRFHVSYVGNESIDRQGINRAIALALKRSLYKLELLPQDCTVLLDGGLRAPDHFLSQKTIIRGDESEPVISLASIVAKVRRDRLMAKFSQIFDKYGFERHKGYATREHFERILEHGPCAIHRMSFLKSLTT
ncbi:ribonuclease HII [Candidatus Parcubacteria bacterium]|nr:ribonuclease HII [Candidatus Parcubacteria bacterium]